ncbi:RRQRL motif-containing zinc-binding protein [Streptomyces lusitanus]|uniref:RRQRL motif-containing zinc-binding protein n=1 Tax=Streptomyces lusitanus TaxID=68232 RepID=A0ABU3K228_9ACTN|nr:RRQRL motif-containing zinc-binding protein [Streptomyces lusitanus]
MARPRKRRRVEVRRVPRSDGHLPEYDRSAVPEGLATRRQLREMGLSPGGHDPVAVLRCKLCATRPQWSCGHPTRGFLFRVDLARPKRTPTLAQEWALDRAMAARSTCPRCRRRYHFCLPLRTQGVCDPCDKGYEPSPDTYTHSPVPVDHRLAA